jgi:glycerol kinase
MGSIKKSENKLMAKGKMKQYIMALDEGTTSCRAIIFDKSGKIAGASQKEFTQIYPQVGWVEHDALEIWNTQIGVMRDVLVKTDIAANEIAAVGITNQRETVVVWDKATGKPIYNAIVWQSRQTADICEKLKAAGQADYIQKTTGLVIDAYFSGTKVKWILDRVPGAREKAVNGEILFGTMDTWIIWNLTKGKVHVTEYSNASRTMLFNIQELKWDPQMLRILDIPAAMLPEVKPSSEVYGKLDAAILGAEIPIGGAAGDQQAALFGQACFERGMIKNTYGTGCFLLMQTGEEPILSKNGLVTTIAWGVDGKVEYALEGSVFIAGAVIQWLRDELKLIDNAKDSEYFASQVADANGVYLVPAFAGLGAPYWDMYARGTMVGLTRGANKNHLIRAALEAIAYQSKDLISAMEDDAGIKLTTLKVDGGAAVNNFLMQFQADILGVPVQRPQVIETTALGAAFLAGLAVKFWKSKQAVVEGWALDKEYTPQMDVARRRALYAGWQKAVAKAKSGERFG